MLTPLRNLLRSPAAGGIFVTKLAGQDWLRITFVRYCRIKGNVGFHSMQLTHVVESRQVKGKGLAEFRTVATLGAALLHAIVLVSDLT